MTGTASFRRPASPGTPPRVLAAGWLALAALTAGAAVLAGIPGAGTGRASASADALVTATLHSAWVHGNAVEGDYATATLLDACLPGGTQTASGDAVAGPGGAYAFPLTDGARQVLAVPGQRLLTSVGEAPTVDVCLPALAARADADTDTVYGVAPPGSKVTVAVYRAAAPPVERSTIARDDASFAVPFADAVDLDAGSSGRAVVDDRPGVLLALRWSIPVLRLELGAPEATGSSPAGRSVNLVASRGGHVAAAGAAIAGDPGPYSDTGAGEWSAVLADADLRPVRLEVGDRVELSAGDQRLGVSVPMMDARVDAAADAVWGLAPPDTALAVTASRDGRVVTTTIRSGADGRYAVSLVGRWDLQPSDEVTVDARLRPDVVVRARAVGSGLAVDLDAGVVEGAGAPGSAVDAELRSADGSWRAAARGVTDADGRYSLPLRDSSGASVHLATADVVSVTQAGRVGSFSIPHLSVTVDSEQDGVHGDASPGGEVTVAAMSPLAGDRGQAVVVADRSPDGAYSANLAGRVDIAASSRVIVTFRSSQGHSARLTRVVPMLEAQRGGSRLSGFAAPEARVRAVLSRGAVALSSRATIAAADGAFALQFVDDEGGALPIAAGDRISVAWTAASLRPPDDEGAVTAMVANLTAAVDADAGVVVGRAEPGRRVRLTARDPVTPGSVTELDAVADPRGWYTATIASLDDRPVRSGVTVTAAVDDESGHRTYVLAVVPLLDLWIDSPSLSGRATPLEPVEAVLLEGEDAIAAAVDRADTLGGFSLILQPSSGGDAEVRPGRSVRLSQAAGTLVTVQVPTLTVEVDPALMSIHGLAPPLSAVEVTVSFRGHPEFETVLDADGQGRWVLAESELPDETSLNQVREAVATVRVGTGHVVSALTVRAPPASTATPSPIASPDPTATTPTPPPDSTRTATATGSPSAAATTAGTSTVTPTATPAVGRAYLPRCDRVAPPR